MKAMSAKDAKNAFGLLLDRALAEPVTVEKHGRPVVVVMNVEEYERLTSAGAGRPAAREGEADEWRPSRGAEPHGRTAISIGRTEG